jgi:predicted RNA-binding protein YlqC (UPF0109 family)
MSADIPQLVATMARALADHPEAVEVEEVDRGRKHIVRLSLAPEDLGRIIGREGRVANAIRTVLGAAATDEAWTLEIKD